MKYLKILSLIFLVISFASCEKDKDDNIEANVNNSDVKSSFSYSGQEYQTPAGYLIYHGLEHEGGYFDLYFVDENAVHNDEKDEFENLTTFIRFDLYSKEPISLGEGTYEYNEDWVPGTLYDVEIVSSDIFKSWWIVEDKSSISIKKEADDNYLIEYDLNPGTDNAVKGSYFGKLIMKYW